jgi:hypothetical protein
MFEAWRASVCWRSEERRAFGGNDVPIICSSATRQPEFVEEVQQEGDMHGALLFDRRLRVGEYCRALAIGEPSRSPEFR